MSFQILYLKNGEERQYDAIIRQARDFSELLESSKHLFSNTITSLKKKKSLVHIFNTVLQAHISKELTTEEYDSLIGDIKTLNQILKNKEDSYELFVPSN